jgi:NADP-dependent 3-hydroxy acid dehydrogenase YdfG
MTTLVTTPIRRAWITGAGSGIGLALARRLASEGWQVAVSARSENSLASVAAGAPGMHSFPLDVTDRAAVTEAVDAIEAQLGPLDLVVLNAGTYQPVTARTFSVEAWRGMVETNMMGTVHCLSAVMPRMIERRAGHIAVVSSLTGYAGLPSASAYGATKAALINMCEALYPELEAESVRLSLINPGFVDTPLTRKNDFPMPFLISSEDAARRILGGLNAGKFEIAFPFRMLLAMRLLSLLPHRFRLAVTRRMVRR